jgi:Uma2 family endonuclease
MSVVAAMSPPAAPPSRVGVAFEGLAANGAGRVLLRHVSWATYQALLADVGDDPVHLTYDDGYLEIEVPSDRHEQLKKAVGKLIEMALERDDVDFEPLGSTTWNAEAKLKGIEADECFYVQNEPNIRDQRPIVLGVHPPPDLAVEVDVSGSSIDKFGIYAALGIPEVWRLSEEGSVRILLRSPDGSYAPGSKSLAVPSLTPEVVEACLRQLKPAGPWTYSDLRRRFAAWLNAPDASPIV